MQHDRIVKEPERREMTGVSRVQWWRQERLGNVPRRRRLSPHAVGWLQSELHEWIQSRPEVMSDDLATS